MNQTDFRWQLGKDGEAVVREWLKAQGYHVIPTSLIETGSAPMLEAQNWKLILPNNLVWREGVPRWIEVKTKSRATLHRTPPRRWEHGFPLRHWDAYLAIQEQTGFPMSVAVLELQTQMLLLNTVERLAVNKRPFFMDGEMHIYLARNDFVPQEPPAYLKVAIPEPVAPKAPRSLSQGVPPIFKQFEMDL